MADLLARLLGRKAPHPYEARAPRPRPTRIGEPPARIVVLDHRRRRDVLVMATQTAPAPDRKANT